MTEPTTTGTRVRETKTRCRFQTQKCETRESSHGARRRYDKRGRLFSSVTNHNNNTRITYAIIGRPSSGAGIDGTSFFVSFTELDQQHEGNQGIEFKLTDKQKGCHQTPQFQLCLNGLPPKHDLRDGDKLKIDRQGHDHSRTKPISRNNGQGLEPRVGTLWIPHFTDISDQGHCTVVLVLLVPLFEKRFGQPKRCHTNNCGLRSVNRSKRRILALDCLV